MTLQVMTGKLLMKLRMRLHLVEKLARARHWLLIGVQRLQLSRSNLPKVGDFDGLAGA